MPENVGKFNINVQAISNNWETQLTHKHSQQQATSHLSQDLRHSAHLTTSNQHLTSMLNIISVGI